MTITNIVGIDCGFEKSVAVMISHEQFDTLEPTEFYDMARFQVLETDNDGLDRLLSLNADLFIIEPTGSYSKIWVENLRLRGKEVRLIPHELLAAFRLNCGWSDKDDYHDAVAIAWYGWTKLNRPTAFNRQRDELLAECYELMLVNEKLANDYTVLVNQSRQMLHNEFPEVSSRDSKITSKGEFPPLWSFIAGLSCPQREQKTLERLLRETIGRAHRNRDGRFSEELKDRASRICQLQLARFQIEKSIHRKIYEDERFNWYHYIFNSFKFGTFDRAIILYQIFPFEQILSENLTEIRKVKLQCQKSKSGKLPKKRVSLARFCAMLGKAPNLRSSGNKHGVIVKGSSMCRKRLYLWANRSIFPNAVNKNSRKIGTVLSNEIGDKLRAKYLTDLGIAKTSQGKIGMMLSESEDVMKDFRERLPEIAGGAAVLSEIEALIEMEPEILPETLKNKSKSVLGVSSGFSVRNNKN